MVHKLLLNRELVRLQPETCLYGSVIKPLNLRFHTGSNNQNRCRLKMGKTSSDRYEMNRVAEEVRSACIEAMKEGFQDASMSGLCTEGAVEAAIGAVQSLNLEKIIEKAVHD